MEEVPKHITEEAARLGFIQLASEPNVFSSESGKSYLYYKGNGLVSVVKN